VIRKQHGAPSFNHPMIHPDRLDEPLRLKKSARILVSFMGDLFGPEVPGQFIGNVINTMEQCQRHEFFLLTKRAERLMVLHNGHAAHPTGCLPPNVHLGVTVTTQAEADERIPLLLATPAARRWVSIEPMLAPVNLLKLYQSATDKAWSHSGLSNTLLGGQKYSAIDFVVVGSIDRPTAQWPAPRREWIESIREQCKAAGVPLWEKNNLRRHGIVKDRPLVQELPS